MGSFRIYFNPFSKQIVFEGDLNNYCIFGSFDGKGENMVKSISLLLTGTMYIDRDKAHLMLTSKMVFYR